MAKRGIGAKAIFATESRAQRGLASRVTDHVKSTSLAECVGYRAITMTATDLLRASLHRWYVILLGLAATVAVVMVMQPQTIYYVSQIVTVQSPPTKLQPKKLGQPDSDPVPAAEMLTDLVNRQSEVLRSRSSDATIYGEGMYDTSSARVVNVGNQWVTSVPLPNIQVESDAPNPEKTLSRQKSEIANISFTLEQLQDRFHVKPAQRLSLIVTPSVPVIEEVAGSRTRAGGAFALVGLVVTLWAVYAIEVHSKRRRSTTEEG